jgi:hypothetical protein
MVTFANFDGSQGTVVVSGYLGVSGKRERSISFWIRTTQQELATICYWGHDFNFSRNEDVVRLSPLNRQVVSSGFPDGSESRVRMIGGYIEMFGKGSRRRSGVRINDGNFHHVVCTWVNDAPVLGHEDFARANIIVDSLIENGRQVGQGQLLIFPDGSVHSSTAVNTPEFVQVVIGAKPSGSGTGYREFFQGDLDEFAVYDDVMSSGTISGAYNGGVRGANLLALDQAAALQFWYRMGDDPGDVVPSGTLPFGTFVDQNPLSSRHGVVSSGVTVS